MLREFDRLSQEKSGYRRLLTDRCFDLYLWYDHKGGSLVGFQLCYNFSNDPHCLTVNVGGSSVHARIDDGEEPGRPHKSTPILVSDGFFPRAEVLRRFDEASTGVEPALRDMVRKAIADYAD